MKKLIFVVSLLLVGVVACDRANEEQVTSSEVATENTVVMVEDAASEDNLITPADISEEAQAAMYQTIFDYNQCMQASRLTSTQQGQSVQQAANDMMSSCETHMDSLEAHLLANNVNASLVIGMTKKMRSRAARKLMTQGMNQMAAQAMAVENAEQMKATESE